MNVSLVVDASVLVSWLRPVDINHDPTLIWMEQYFAKSGLLVAPAILLVEVTASISRQTGQVMRAREVHLIYSVIHSATHRVAERVRRSRQPSLPPA